MEIQQKQQGERDTSTSTSAPASSSTSAPTSASALALATTAKSLHDVDLQSIGLYNDNLSISSSSCQRSRSRSSSSEKDINNRTFKEMTLIRSIRHDISSTLGGLLMYIEDSNNQHSLQEFIKIKNSNEIFMNFMKEDYFFQQYLSKTMKKNLFQYLFSNNCCNPDQLNTRGSISPPMREFPDIIDDDQPMKGYYRLPFDNHGKTIHNTPQYIFFPTTKIGIQNIVKFARENNLKVRVCGYHHTLTDFYSADDQILISLVPKEYTDYRQRNYHRNRNNPLMEISLVEIDGEKALCKIGPAITNEMFRHWANENGFTMPFNVILSDNTFAGTSAMLCHGSGIQHPTISDLVREIEFVNANGDIQTVNDPALLRAAGGCFGILGPVLSLTLELVEMSYAVIEPRKVDVSIAIPPPNFDERYIPKQLRQKSYSRVDMENAFDEFKTAVESCYYSEYTWFAYNDQCFINNWQNNGKKEDVKLSSQWMESNESWGRFLANLMDDSSFEKLPVCLQARVLSAVSMSSLPTHRETLSLADALHFRCGIQNLRVRNFELEIPLNKNSDGTFNLGVIQEAWWDLIKMVYDNYPISDLEDDTPFRFAMDLRITGGSDMLLAPQHGFDATCSIEVSTPHNTDINDWNEFVQRVSDMWMRYDYYGVRLKSRPHWAKQWPPTFDGIQPIDFIRERYRDELPNFFESLKLICTTGGTTLQDLKMFCSPFLLELFFPYLGEEEKSLSGQYLS